LTLTLCKVEELVMVKDRIEEYEVGCGRVAGTEIDGRATPRNAGKSVEVGRR
jgi:hypothetical protein